MRASALRRGVVGLALTVGLLSAAVPAQALEVVRGDGARWRPARVAVSRGEAVRWRAVFRAHVVKSIGAKWSYRKSIAQGDSVRRVFRKRGRFRYYCTIHGTVSGGTCSGMCGRVVVG